LNLNGDYISDALAAQVGGIGIAPVPISIIRPDMPFLKHPWHCPQICQPGQSESFFSHSFGRDDAKTLQWDEAADLIIKAMEKTSPAKS
jgi:isocitrate dehydrogenase